MEAIHHYSERGNHMSEIILETKLVGDITGKFFIPSYQRGYRWGKDEVERLLDDVYSIGEASGRTKTTACSLLLYEERLKMNLN